MYYRLTGTRLILSQYERSTPYTPYLYQGIDQYLMNPKPVESIRSFVDHNINWSTIENFIKISHSQIKHLYIQNIIVDEGTELQTIMEQPYLETVHLHSIKTSHFNYRTLLNKDLYIKILDTLKNNTTITAFTMFWYESRNGKTIGDYYQYPEVQKAAKEMIENNNTLKFFYIGAFSEIKNTEVIYDIFKNSTSLKRCVTGHEDAGYTLEDRLTTQFNKNRENLILKWHDGLGVIDLVSAIERISPTPLKCLLEQSMKSHFTIDFEAYDIKNTVQFYKKDPKCKKLIEEFEENNNKIPEETRELIDNIDKEATNFLVKYALNLKKESIIAISDTQSIENLLAIRNNKYTPECITSILKNCEDEYYTCCVGEFFDLVECIS